MTPTPSRARVLTGIQSVEDIKDRCVIDDITGCWNWGMGLDGGLRPSLWLPQLRRRTTVGVALCLFETGAPPAPGVVWHLTCCNRLCANPAHRKVGTRTTQMRAAKIKRTPLTRALMSKNRRGGSRLQPQQFEDIRSGGKLLREICAEHGISMTYASVIRSGKHRSPVAAPGSSVFALAGRQR